MSYTTRQQSGVEMPPLPPHPSGRAGGTAEEAAIHTIAIPPEGTGHQGSDTNNNDDKKKKGDNLYIDCVERQQHNNTNNESSSNSTAAPHQQQQHQYQRRCLSPVEAVHAFFVPSAFFDVTSVRYLMISGIRPLLLLSVAGVIGGHFIAPLLYSIKYPYDDTKEVYIESNLTYWHFSEMHYAYGEVKSGGEFTWTQDYPCTEVRDLMYSAMAIAATSLIARVVFFYVFIGDSFSALGCCVCECLRTLSARAFVNKIVFPVAYTLIGVLTLVPYIMVTSYWKGVHYCEGTEYDTGSVSLKDKGLHVSAGLVLLILALVVEAVGELVRFFFFMSTFIPRKEEAIVAVVGEGGEADNGAVGNSANEPLIAS